MELIRTETHDEQISQDQKIVDQLQKIIDSLHADVEDRTAARDQLHLQLAESRERVASLEADNQLLREINDKQGEAYDLLLQRLTQLTGENNRLLATLRKLRAIPVTDVGGSYIAPAVREKVRSIERTSLAGCQAEILTPKKVVH